MNVLLWIGQIILGIKFIIAAVSHGILHGKPEMEEAIQTLGGNAELLLYGVGLALFLCVLGLFLPAFVKLPSWVTPGAAAVLSILSLSSIYFHLVARSTPNVFVSMILFLIALAVGYGRWRLPMG